jgi:hypothetical protein
MTQEQIVNAKLECLKAALAMNPCGNIDTLISMYNALVKALGI